MDEIETVGQRIAATRKLMGLTQQQLASAACVSTSMLTKVESGHASASTTWIGAVARVLGVDALYLSGGPNLAGDLGNAQAHRLVADVRRVLAVWDLPRSTADVDLDEIRLGDLAADVATASDLRRMTAYAKLAAMLPGLLISLKRAEQQFTGRDLEQVYGLYSMTYRAVNSLAHKLGYPDMSLTALDRMNWAAERAGDHLLSAMVDYLRAAALGRLGEQDAAVHLLTRAADAVSPEAARDEQARAVLGCLHMKLISIYGAMADPDRVAVHLAEAERLAAGWPEQLVYETTFGPTNVRLHNLSARVDLAQPGQALDVAEGTQLPPGMARERVTYYYIDLARAHLLNGNADGAIDALYEARAVAPLHFASSGAVRNVLHAVATAQHRAGGRLRHLAATAGIPVEGVA
jgi:transcriptional regulator with XRE-family HTH domain